MSTETDIKTERKNTTLWILLGSFIVPMIVAYVYFFYGDRPSVSSNGVLINPVVDIETLGLSDETGNLLDRDTLTPKWRIYTFVDSSCDTNCQQKLFNMRQINVALGKNRQRLQHVIVHLTSPDSNFTQLIETEHQEAIRLYAKDEAIKVLANNPAEKTNQQALYLVDPLGNIMMKFSTDLTAKLILKDINKLLKISRIG